MVISVLERDYLQTLNACARTQCRDCVCQHVLSPTVPSVLIKYIASCLHIEDSRGLFRDNATPTDIKFIPKLNLSLYKTSYAYIS